MTSRKITGVVAIIILSQLIFSCKKNSELEVNVFNEKGLGQTYEVVSKSDEVEIVKISFNRGNCKGTYQSGKPSDEGGLWGAFGLVSTESMSVKLKFGDRLRGIARCQIEEMEVETGTEIYTFGF